MASIRVRLTTGFAAGLIVAITVFSVMMWARLQSETGDARLRDASRRLTEPIVSTRVDIAAGLIRQHGSPGALIVQDSTGALRLRDELTRELLAIPGFVMVFDTASVMVFSSADVKDLARVASPTAERDSARGDYNLLVESARGLEPTSRIAYVDMGSGSSTLVQGRFLTSNPGALERVVVGAIIDRSFVEELEQTAKRDLMIAILTTAPLILIGSVIWASLLAGRTVRPIDRIIDELEAITDGRSLHRRLKGEEAGDELARLTTTLNAMLGRLEIYFGALRRFTADASHELKTPLAVLRADVERAMSGSSSSTEQMVYLEEALAETTRMAGLVDQLLTLARADEGRFDLHREPIAIEPLVRDVFETALILAETGELTVKLSAAEPAIVPGDRTRLRQLFLNLITNAIKYTPRGGEVELSLRVRDGIAVFSVRDTGIGIAAADLPHIFERFWRADRVRSRGAERGGFGLGLAISQWIAQAHGGTLTATSRLTRGSIFTVTLPVAPTVESDVPTEDAAEAPVLAERA